MLRLLLLAWAIGGALLPGATQMPAPARPLASVPFEVVGGVVVLRNLPFNGRRGDFILATDELPVTQFELGDMRPPAVAQATSLAAFRPVVGPQLLGFIGTGLLHCFEVVIDYTHRWLSFYALGPQQSAARPYTRRDSVAFTLKKG